MYHSIHEFLEEWKEERDCTLKYFRTLTNESLGTRAVPDGRSLGYLAWHLVLTLGEMPREAGLTVDTIENDAPQPATVAAIVAEYESSAQAMAESVRTQWNDAMLGTDVPMYGETWKRGAVLQSLIMHQAHHRGQMQPLMRIAGLQVPGIYGPSREEWVSMGMQAPT